MKHVNDLSEINKKILLAQEYGRLISLPSLSEQEKRKMVEILEAANFDQDLNYYIEKAEMENYLGLKEEENEEEGIQRLLEVVTTELEDRIFSEDCNTTLPNR